MKVGVTGGSGFIGSHVVDALLEEGHDVYIIDRLQPEFINENEVEFIETNILSLDSCLNATNGLDAVYHLAAMANANKANEEKVLAYKLNVEGTLNISNACVKNNVKKLIYASTEWVYSALEEKNKIIELDERAKLVVDDMSHIYSVTKYLGEVMSRNFTLNTDTEITILRFGIPYGPRAWEGTVFYNFLNNALNGKGINIKGTGDQFRRFVYVKDLAKGCAAVLNKESTKNEIYNLTGDESTTINELAHLVRNIFNNNVEINYSPARDEDFGGVIADNSKAKNDLNWSPTVKIEDGVTQYLNWLNDHSKLGVY